MDGIALHFFLSLLFCLLSFCRAQVPSYAILNTCSDSVVYKTRANAECITDSVTSFNLTCVSSTNFNFNEWSDATCTTAGVVKAGASGDCILLGNGKYLNATCSINPVTCGNLTAPTASTVGCISKYDTKTVNTTVAPYTTIFTTTQIYTGRVCNMTCNSGYHLNGSSTSSCDHSSYTTWSNPLGTCVDVDECANVSLSKCPSNSVCVNSVGSFSCKCGVGYKSNTTTGKCDSKAFACPKDGSICGYFNLSIPFVPTGTSSAWKKNFTNMIISNFSNGAPAFQFVINYKPILSTGMTQVQIQISSYNATNISTPYDSSLLHDPHLTWVALSQNATVAAADKSNVFSAYLSGLKAVEINPPLVVTTVDLAFIGVPFILIFTVLCAKYGKKRREDTGHGPTNVTTLPEPAEKPTPTVEPKPQEKSSSQQELHKLTSNGTQRLTVDRLTPDQEPRPESEV
jgi:hypothetical protein